MPEIKVAIVGCGCVANGHLRAWKKVSSTKVIAVSDVNNSLAKSTAETWHIPHNFGSLSELVKLGDTDVVDICTPPQTHALLSVEAMEAGFNVLIEKPMAMTVKDAEQIVKSQKSTGAKAGVIHNWLFEAPIRKADALLKKGYLGEILSMEVEALCTRNDSMALNKNHWCHAFPGGRFSEMLAHPIYLLMHFLGDAKVRDVQVAKLGSYPWMRSDELFANFRSGNKLGRAYISFNSPRDAIFVRLYGEKAILSLEIINATLILLPSRKTSRYGKGVDSLRQASQLVKSTVGNAGTVAVGRWLSGHDAYMNLFVESLQKDSEPPVSVEEGLNVTKTLVETCEQITHAEKR